MREWRNGSRPRIRIWWVRTRAGSSPAFRTICSGSSSGKNTLRIRVILVRIQYGTIGHYPSWLYAWYSKMRYSTIFGLHFLLLGNLKNVPFIHQTLTRKLWWAFVDDQADSPLLLEFVGEIRTRWCWWLGNKQMRFICLSDGMVDVSDSKSDGRESVRVQVPP